MILVTQSGDQYDIRFPYNEDLIQLVKDVPGRTWNPTSKCWSIHKDRLGFFLKRIQGTQYESELSIQSNENINQNSSIDATSDIPDIDVSDVDWYVQDGCKLFQHQIDTVKYDKYRNENGMRSGFLLADQPGSGKTLSVLNVAMYHKKKYGSKHCLIIACVNSAKYNWMDDISKHSNGTIVPYILGARRRRNGTIRYDTGGKEKLQDLQTFKKYGDKNSDDLPYFIILNIESLRAKEGRTYTITSKITELINKGEIGVIAIDEIHKNASPSSIQGKQLLAIKKGATKNVEWIPMTGTPITSKPTDVFLPLRLVDGHNKSSYYMWCQNFCIYGGFGGKEIVGYRNIPQLKLMLQPNMLRRLKKDILDLPPKLRYTEYVENTEYQDRLYKLTKQEISDNRGTIMQSMNPLAQFLKLRQVNGSPELVDHDLTIDNSYISKNAKLARLLELLEDITANGEKVVVFSNWVEPLRTLYKFISPKYKTCCYTGTMSQEDREKHKKAFISNPDYKIILGTVGALGTSHTLTVARNVIFYDSPWNPSDIEQCEDRCHRPGTSECVNVYTLVTKDTVDEVVHNLLYKKEGTAKYIVDNDLDLKNHPELFDLMMGNV